MIKEEEPTKKQLIIYSIMYVIMMYVVFRVIFHPNGSIIQILIPWTMIGK